MSPSAYRPFEPARRPSHRPSVAPAYRVLVHRQYKSQYDRLVERVGAQSAQAMWDFLSQTPYEPPPTAGSCILRGTAGRPKGPGWSRTVHYELSSMARVNYQFHNEYVTGKSGDAHRIVAILTINLSSH